MLDLEEFGFEVGPSFCVLKAVHFLLDINRTRDKIAQAYIDIHKGI